MQNPSYPKNNSIKNLLIFGKNYLKEKGIESFALDTNLLLSNITGLDKISLITKDHILIDDKQVQIYLDFLKRRGNNEPIQYILNNQEFMGLDFYVDKNVLIPRPDTEILVEKAISEIKKIDTPSVLEIGTGSGCISISLKKFLPNINIQASDISEKALEIANLNAKKNKVDINFIKSDIYSNIAEKFDFIISNPPYIESEIIYTLEKNVLDYEPHLALDGGKDGLYFYKEIIDNSRIYLKKTGAIFFEIGYNQGKAITELFKNNKFKTEILKDYSGKDRVVCGWIGEI